MKRFVIIVLAIAAATLFAGLARADGPNTVFSAATSVSKRCYLGVDGVGSFTRHSEDVATVTLNGLSNVEPAIGFLVGCDYRSGKFLVGGFADYTHRINTDKASLLGLITSTGLGNQWSAGARVGFLATPGTLVYVGGAYTVAQDNNLAIGTLPINFAGPKGLAALGGIEAKLTDLVSAKIEYRYVDFGQESSTVMTLPINKSTVEHQIRVGINFDFYNSAR